jgi:transmembrane sensor
MNEPLPPDDPIEEAASAWLVQRAEGFSSAQRREFERWRQADPRHAAAVARLEATCALLEQMPVVRAELQPVVEFPAPARALRPRPRRTPAFAPLLVGLAAVVTLAAIGGWLWQRAQPAALQYVTSIGGYERVVLADGSLLELNASSEVHVDLAVRERRLALVRGEAHFTVAPDPGRPFIVSAGGVAVRAVGTAFNVRLAAAAVEVLVTEGQVAVSEPVARSGSTATATFLRANERTQVRTSPSRSGVVAAGAPASAPLPAASPVIERLAPEALRDALSWQERRLVFSATPLREVVVQFNRRNRVQLVLGDPALGERPVGGTFAADNVEGFVRLLEGSDTFRVERRDDGSVVLRAAP